MIKKWVSGLALSAALLGSVPVGAQNLYYMGEELPFNVAQDQRLDGYILFSDANMLDRFRQEDEATRYQKALAQHQSNSLPQGVFDAVARLEYLDVGKVNAYLLQLMNNERARLGVEPLVLSDVLPPYAQVRADELASAYTIRPVGVPHTRLDGSPWFSVFGEGGVPFLVGENLLSTNAVAFNPYRMVSERYVAEKIFDIWFNSPEHYENMVDSDYNTTYTQIAFSQHQIIDGKQLDLDAVFAVQHFGQE